MRIRNSVSAPRLLLLALAAAFGCSSEGSSPAGGEAMSSGGAASSGGGTSPGGGAGASAGASGASGAASAGTSAGGQSTTGGSAGASGGSPTGCAGPAPAVSDELVGWAAVAGDGVETTIGGLGGDTVTATSADELKSYAASAEPLIIQIESALAVGTLDVVSNKTLLGIGPAATILGGIRVRPLKSDDPIVSNVIIRHLRVDAASAVPDDGGDGIHIERAHHVWIDHCEIWDSPDGNTDITHGSNWVTVSWTKYHYTSAAPNPDHRFSNLIGHSEDAADTDRDRLNVTYHHNWWADGIEQRMPRVRFGDVHVFNNYVAATGAVAAVAAGTEAKLVVENNHFEGVNDPHFFHEGSATAQIVASGNAYVNVTGKQDVGQGPAFTPPYPYELEPASQVPCDVSLGAGPR